MFTVALVALFVSIICMLRFLAISFYHTFLAYRALRSEWFLYVIRFASTKADHLGRVSERPVQVFIKGVPPFCLHKKDGILFMDGEAFDSVVPPMEDILEMITTTKEQILSYQNKIVFFKKLLRQASLIERRIQNQGSTLHITEKTPSK